MGWWEYAIRSWRKRAGPDAVLTFLLRRTRDRRLSHDLTAETFFAASRAAADFDEGDVQGAGPWLSSIARTRLREHASRP